MFAKVRPRLSGLVNKSARRVRKRQPGILGCIWDVELTDIIGKDMPVYVFCFKKEESKGRYTVEPKKEKGQFVKRLIVEHR